MHSKFLINTLTLVILSLLLVACGGAEEEPLPTLAPTVGSETAAENPEANDEPSETDTDEETTDDQSDTESDSPVDTDTELEAQTTSGSETLTVDIDYARANNVGEEGTASLSIAAPDGWSISEQSVVRPEVYTFLSLNQLPDSPVDYAQQAESLPGFETTHDVNGVTVYEYRSANDGLPAFRRNIDGDELIVTAFAYGDDNAVVLDFVDDLVQIVGNTNVTASDLPELDPSTIELSDDFTAFVSGAIEGSMVSAFGVDVCTSGTTQVKYTNIFNNRDGEVVGDVSFTFTADATVGEYTYDPVLAEIPDVGISSYVEPQDESENYTQPVDYTFTIDSIATAPGEAFSGSYEITLRRLSDEADTTDTATVTGTFTHVMDELCE